MKDAPRKPSFVVAFNRDRDSYQVALALAEAGMLEALVTDYYSSPLRAKLLPQLKHRQIAGIDAGLTRGSLLAVLAQVIGPRIFGDMNATLSYTSRVLGSKVRSAARRSHADLLLYSEHAFEAFTDPKLQDRRRILFSFHPHRKLIREIISADTERFPEIAWREKDDVAAPELEARENAELDAAELVLCASSFTKRSLVHAGVLPGKIAVIPYGAPERREVAAVHRGSGECRFLFVGQGVQRKGLHHLLKVWNTLALPNALLTLVCYKIDPAIDSLIGANVRVLSALPQEELDAEFARSHVFVMPSLVEGFGLVFLEAMAAGCYVIGTSNTGLPDLDVPSDLASIVEAGKLDQIAEAMEGAYAKHQEGALQHNAIARFAKGRSRAAFRETLRGIVLEFVK